MLDFSKVKIAVVNWFNSFKNQPVISGCDHLYSFQDQAWVRISSKQYKLKNRNVCSKCNTIELREISGE